MAEACFLQVLRSFFSVGLFLFGGFVVLVLAVCVPFVWMLAVVFLLRSNRFDCSLGRDVRRLWSSSDS